MCGWFSQVTESIARMHVLCNGLKQPFGSAARPTAHPASTVKDSARYGIVVVSNSVLLLHPFNGVFSWKTLGSWYQKGKANLDLNEARDNRVFRWQWHQLDHMRTVCTSFQMDNHTSTPSLNFFRPDVLPDAQPPMSKHWRYKALKVIMCN